MHNPPESILYANEAYCLSSLRLEQPGLVAELTGPGHSILRITRHGEVREVQIPAVPREKTGYRGSIPVLNAMYALAAHEMQQNISPDGLLLAGASWHTAWTRDTAYAVTLGAAYLEPEACRRSLESRVKNDLIVQDTGTGGGWPISTDRVSWVLAAWTYYLASGDREWLEYSLRVAMNTMAQDDAVLTCHGHLRPGETSFIDWREQSYPAWMNAAEIGASYAFGTNVLHYVSRRIVARMLCELGRSKEATLWQEEATAIAADVQEHFWSRATQSYGMMRTEQSLEERVDALATALSVITGLSSGTQAHQAMNSIPRTPWGTPVFAPFKEEERAAYHNRSIWPFVEAYVLLAHAELQDTRGAAQSMAAMLRAAMAFGTNKENFEAVSGEASGTIQNSDRQLWSVAGMLGMYYFGLFGMQYEGDNLVFAPCVPKSFGGSHWLTNLRVRDMVLDVHINGYGTEICSVRINGKAASPIIPLDTKGRLQIELELIPTEDEQEAPPAYPAAVDDLPTPQWEECGPALLSWKPVPGATSYCVYANGTAISTTGSPVYVPSPTAAHYTEYRVQASSTTNASALSRPWEYCRPGARQLLAPTHIGEQAEYTVEWERAWLDTRPCTAHLNYEPVTLAAGTYRIRICYVNATASRRDGDTCALRQLFLNGQPGSIIPFPHNTEQDNWDAYTYTAGLSMQLPAGVHTFSLRYTPLCANTAGHTNQCMVSHLEITRLA